MTERLSLGCKEILFWKLIYAVTCSVLSQVLFLISFIFIMNLNIFHPITWFGSTLSSLTSIGNLLLLLPLGLIIFIQGIICSKNYVFESSYRTNRILKILGVFSIRNLLIIICHIITGGLIVRVYLNILGGKHDKIHKDGVLVEEAFFMLLNGFWIGLFYFFKQYIRNEKTISFPIIQQNKFLTVRSTIASKLKQAMRESIWPTVYFVVIYYYRGIYIRNWFIHLNNLKLNESASVFHVISVNLLIYSWIFSTIFIFTMLCMKMFFEVFLTEHWTFPIESEYSHVLSLKEALTMNNVPIIQHLACLDLYMLSIWEPIRRQQLFTLSQPGGHPHNWNNLLQEVLTFITNFSSEINKATDAIMIPEASVVKTKEAATIDYQNLNIQQPVYRSPLRNMSLSRSEPVDIVNVTKNDLFTTVIDNFKLSVMEKIDNIITSIKKKSGVQYFFGDLPESRIYFLLLKGQPVIWAIQGLSLIVTASFKEDKYGVIQKDLPVILTTLINLKQNLDKLNKVTIVSRKSYQSDVFKMQLKIALRSAVKRSLYNICNVFGEYLGHLQLNKEVFQQINNFVLYREG